MNNFRFKIIFLITLIMLFIVSACSPQEAASDGSPIEFVGNVTVIEGESLTVGGFSVDISNASVPVDGFTIGDEVRVTGLSQGTNIVAVVVVLVDETQVTDTVPEPTNAPTDDAEPSPEASEDVAPTDVPDEPTTEPEPTQDTPTQAAPTQDTTDVPSVVIDGEPILVIEGPVQAINIDTVTIFDIDIQVDAADPILTQIRIGDTIRIEGESSFEGTTIIIVAINITIIETSIIVINNPVYVVPGIPSNCRRTPRGRVTCRGSQRHTHRSSRGSRRS